MTTKRCRRCSEVKVLNDFHRNCRLKDGHLNVCKICRCTQEADYRQHNLEAVRTRATARRVRDREKINSANADYRRRNLERLRAYDRDYYKRNCERLKAYQAEYKMRYGHVVQEYQATYRVRNRERLRAWHREYRANNPELLAWRERLKSSIRRAQQKSTAVVRFSEAELRAKFAYWDDCCWVCGDPATAVDHVKPLSAGGSHLLCNLRPICRRCNSAKNGKWPLPSRASILGFAA